MNIDQARNSSNAFHLAFQRCMEQRPTGPDQVEFLAIPGIVCVAFSIELGFKTLALRAGKKSTGHELDKLFAKLDSSQQTALINAVGLPDADFRKNLANTSRAFVDWRYIYEEHRSVSVNLVMSLLFRHDYSG